VSSESCNGWSAGMNRRGRECKTPAGGRADWGWQSTGRATGARNDLVPGQLAGARGRGRLGAPRQSLHRRIRTGLRENATGLCTCASEFSDIQNSSSRERPRKSRPSAAAVRYWSTETGLFVANLRKCRHFCEHPKSAAPCVGFDRSFQTSRPMGSPTPGNRICAALMIRWA
jgi:hypothetical protein